METNVLVAANVRARMAWHRLPQARLKDELGWSQRTIQNKLGAVTGITSDELVRLAKLFGLSDPGPLYRVPDGFSPELSGRSPSSESDSSLRRSGWFEDWCLAA